jgi:hypothetical protein
MNVELLALILLMEILVFVYTFRDHQRMDPKLKHETDLRLTYKRYTELYPTATLTYLEYKKLQTRQAFKRSISSKKIKRMVR